MGWIRETLILDGYNQAINGYREDLYNMAYKCGQLNDENADLRADIRDLEDENAELKKDIELHLSLLETRLKGLIEQDKTIKNNEVEIASLKEELEKLKEDLRKTNKNIVLLQLLESLSLYFKLDQVIAGNENLIKGILSEMQRKSLPEQRGVNAET